MLLATMSQTIKIQFSVESFLSVTLCTVSVKKAGRLVIYKWKILQFLFCSTNNRVFYIPLKEWFVLSTFNTIGYVTKS